MAYVYPTHEVINQVPPLEDINPFSLDLALQEGLNREGGSWARERVAAFGDWVGSAETLEHGRQANRNPPELLSHDRYGHRLDRVDYHPAYHHLMAHGVQNELHCLPWTQRKPGAHAARLAMHYLLNHAESGVCCPLTMTFAVVPALEREPDVAAEWVPRILAPHYDGRFLPAAQKRGCTFGMAMTEKQGGSDVRANSTRARAFGGSAREFLLTGHKWFCSAPMSDAFLTLAQTSVGLTCFLVPRFRPDGSRNAIYLQRLKDKVGNRSNGSSEIEYGEAWALRIGPEGRGVPTIIEMVNHTRLDCVSGTAGLMRAALVQALHHARHRQAFGKRLWDQPLMRNVLADLALEVEAATLLLMRLARAYDESADPKARSFARLATAVAKFWVCKQGPGLAFEAMECLGGAGYVEEGPMGRIYREMPLCSIWEGSGNVMCLDVLRALGREPDSRESFLAELTLAQGANPDYDRELAKLRDQLGSPVEESAARRLVERMALLLQASLMLRHAPSAAAELFCESRLAVSARIYGTLPAHAELGPILERALPT